MAPSASDMFTPVSWKDGEETILPLGAGFAIILGFGVFFSLLISAMTFIETRATGKVITSEQFNTAGHSLKTGLTGAAIVSQWTWAATLLQSSNVAWQYGISGPFWYAAGASIQVLLFGILAIEIKQKAPTAHTFLEFVYRRWGKTAHIVMLCYAVLTNTIVSAMLLLGGAAVTNALTGMDTALASFLIPWGVILYTMTGGLKATIMAQYLNTIVIMVTLCFFVCVVYIQSPLIGSSGKMYDLLEANRVLPLPTLAELSAGYHSGPVSGNREGSHITMLSGPGLMFGIINIIGNFGTVFLDQSYWQSAIAAKPSASHKGYMLGGLVWFCIPFSLATSLGLAATALGVKLTPAEAGAGLVPPAIAVVLVGRSGAVAILIMLFMAIVSTGSAEMMAVGSISAYDIYFTYINPKATGKRIIFITRVVTVVFGALMGVLAVILDAFGIGLGWVYLFMGIVIGGAVAPVAFCLTWSKTNRTAAIVSPIFCTGAAIIAWCVTASTLFGEVTVDTLGTNEAMLAGNCVALFGSLIMLIVWSLIFPENYDFKSMREIPQIDEIHDVTDEEEEDPEMLKHAHEWVEFWGWIMVVVIIFLWPIATLPWGVFPKALFSIWVSVSLIWAIVGSGFVVLLPIIESMDTFSTVVNSLRGMPRTAKGAALKGV